MEKVLTAFLFFLFFFLQENALQQWNLESRVIATTTDRGSNIKKCMELFGAETGASWLPCASHTIQICIRKAWEEGGAVDLLDKCSKIAKVFRHKGSVSNYLKYLQRKQESALKPILENDTRWNSRHEMAKRIYELR
jgi:hypothetical protein